MAAPNTPNKSKETHNFFLVVRGGRSTATGGRALSKKCVDFKSDKHQEMRRDHPRAAGQTNRFWDSRRRARRTRRSQESRHAGEDEVHARGRSVHLLGEV